MTVGYIDLAVELVELLLCFLLFDRVRDFHVDHPAVELVADQKYFLLDGEIPETDETKS